MFQTNVIQKIKNEQFMFNNFFFEDRAV